MLLLLLMSLNNIEVRSEMSFFNIFRIIGMSVVSLNSGQTILSFYLLKR